MPASWLAWRFVGACGGDRSTGPVMELVVLDPQPTSEVAKTPKNNAADRLRRNIPVGLHVSDGFRTVQASEPASGAPIDRAGSQQPWCQTDQGKVQRA